MNIGLVLEGPTDFRVITAYLDRLLVTEIDWIEKDNLPDYRQWTGCDDSHSYLSWKGVRDLHLKHLGRFQNRQWGYLDRPETDTWSGQFITALKALAVLKHLSQPEFFVLVWDTDGEKNRFKDLDSARSIFQRRFKLSEKVLVGLPHHKIEAWILAGFEPQNETETQQLETERQRLHFCPVEKPHLLNAKEESGLRSAKRLVTALIASPTREEQCLWESHLTLENSLIQGENSGRQSFLQEIQTLLLPKFDPGYKASN